MILCSVGGSFAEISLRPIVAALLSILICGCTYSGGTVRGTHQESEDAQPKKNPDAGLVANLQGVGSAVTGKVRVVDRGDGVTVMVSGSNLPPNQFRVSFNQNPNCTSPNGFSAGPPWAPPGLNPYELIPLFWNPDGNAEGTAFIRGVHTTGENGVAGRSVVIYWGSKVTDAKPGVPNNRAACGVFEPASTLLF